MSSLKKSSFAWGAAETQFFFALTPEHILRAVESFGARCTGRCLTLNSMENRVFEVEVEGTDGDSAAWSPTRRVIKFYRPGRWSREQILDEHRFLADLDEAGLTVVAPLRDADGATLRVTGRAGIYYALFPRVAGRNADEFTDEQLKQIGRLLARLHNTAAVRPHAGRLTLSAATYGMENLEYLYDSGTLPDDIADDYADIVEDICAWTAPLLAAARGQRIHGDCHLGNVLWRADLPFLVDFDDTVSGPCVQDIWLLVPGRDRDADRQRRMLLEAYESLRAFDRAELALTEPLRALRYVHFSAWTAKRWRDPAFPRAFPHFTDRNYWRDQLLDLRECYDLMRQA
ncbi:MAG: serine/threonine protein kinase [Verrucomicrobiales bacterium]|jgi:Ser/Thr protein kinase RdoA (MazF antagonist)|nr:serine/threonine protein kinase [Verrucomicrobiales bacterium]